MSYDVFISYSAEDKPTADAVVAGLENHRIRCWIAPRDIGAGKEYGAEIIAGITRCKVMVLIFSMRSNNSNQVVREVERAIHSQKIIIPFRIQNTSPTGSMEYFLSLPHWLDAYTAPLSKHVEELAATVASILSGNPVEASLPPPLPSAKRRLPWMVPAIFGGAAVTLLLAVVLVWVAVKVIFPSSARPARPPTQTVAVAAPSPVRPPPQAAVELATPVPLREGEAAANLLARDGLDLYNQGNYDAALEKQNKAVELDPKNAYAHLQRGITFKAKQNPQAAIEDYNAALKLKPGYAIVYYNRGNAYVALNDDVTALADFSKAIELDPKSYLAFNNRGCLYRRQGAFDLAIADFNSSLSIKPDYEKAHANRESTLRAKNSPAKPPAANLATKLNIAAPTAPTPPATATSPAAATAPKSTALFDNGNIYATLNNPTRATMFTINAACRITAITTYHWNSGQGAEPGTIRLVQQGGKVFGPWKAAGVRGQGSVPNATWIVKPDVNIPAGTYTVIDSSPPTWSQNAASQGSGFTRIEGFEIR